MNCPICKKQMVESNYKAVYDDGIFYQEYFCFNCYKLFECSSQSGDMIEEYLDLIGEIR